MKFRSKNHFTRNASKFAFLGLMSFGLLGCVNVLPKAGKPALIAPFRASDNVETRTHSNTSIIVDLPTMPRGLSGSDIAIVLKDGSMAYVDGVNLIAPAPNSIQGLIIETFDKSDAFRLATKETASMRSDYFLALDVSRFEVVEPIKRESGKANVSITARLIAFPNRKPIANRLFEITMPAKKGSALEPALALEAATQNAASQILDWTVQQIREQSN